MAPIVFSAMKPGAAVPYSQRPCMRSPKGVLILILFICTPCWSCPDVSSGVTAPWQQDTRTITEESRYEDYEPTVFSPSGRIYAIESVIKATNRPDNPTSNLAIAMTCKDGIVVMSSLPMSPYLNSTMAMELCQIGQLPSPILEGDTFIAVSAGNAVDRLKMRFKIEGLLEQSLESEGFFFQDGRTLNVDDIARRLADHLQASTQDMSSRSGPLVASSALLAGNDQLWRIDPNGQFWECHAATIGRAADQAQEKLFELILEQAGDDTEMETFFNELEVADAIELAGKCMQATLRPKYRAASSGGSVATKDPPMFWHAAALFGDGRRRNWRGYIRGEGE